MDLDGCLELLAASSNARAEMPSGLSWYRVWSQANEEELTMMMNMDGMMGGGMMWGMGILGILVVLLLLLAVGSLVKYLFFSDKRKPD